MFKTAIKRVDGENMKGAKKVGKVVTANDVIGKQNKDDLVNLISGLIGLIRSRFDEVRLDCSGYLWNTRWEGGGTFTKNFSDFLDYSKLRKAVIFDFCLVGDCDENDHDDVVSVGITSYNKNGDAIATFQSDEMDERLFENPKEIKGRFLRIFINAIGGEKSAKRKEVGEN